MPVSLGGSLGITFPDAKTTPASEITARFSPFITNTANVMSLQGVNINGSVGVFTPTETATTIQFNANIVISANTSNYVLNTAKVTGYQAGITNLTVTINSGVFISSSSTGSYAFTINNSWAAGDKITIVNNGVIIGRGGNGGGGSPSNSTPGAGGSGGPAVLAQFPVSIRNNNTVAGGGGGGGGGSYGVGEAGGGGGGGGIGGSNGGGGGASIGQGTNGDGGSGGTLTAIGLGGAGGTQWTPKQIYYAGNGGNGGNYGSSGLAGGAVYTAGGAGGAGGACTQGGSFITWTVAGTRGGALN
jgi:hypothetical protein